MHTVTAELQPGVQPCTVLIDCSIEGCVQDGRAMYNPLTNSLLQPKLPSNRGYFSARVHPAAAPSISNNRKRLKVLLPHGRKEGELSNTGGDCVYEEGATMARPRCVLPSLSYLAPQPPAGTTRFHQSGFTSLISNTNLTAAQAQLTINLLELDSPHRQTPQGAKPYPSPSSS